MDPVMERLERIEEKLDRALMPKEVVSAEEAMPLTGCKSVSAQFRWFRINDVRPYTKGKYRVRDIRNKTAALALAQNRQ